MGSPRAAFSSIRYFLTDAFRQIAVHDIGVTFFGDEFLSAEYRRPRNNVGRVLHGLGFKPYRRPGSTYPKENDLLPPLHPNT